jgi:hypothetical protein
MGFGIAKVFNLADPGKKGCIQPVASAWGGQPTGLLQYRFTA